jgi:hypothetical protein
MVKNLLTMSLAALLLVSSAWAQDADPELLKAKEFFETAGNPEGKWIEGETMVPHVAPARHHKASLLYYPGTEELQDDEVRVIFMGSTYYPSQTQRPIFIKKKSKSSY